MLFTILSMSDCHGICFLIIDSGVSVDMSAWGLCVNSKSGCFSDNHQKLSVMVLMVVIVLAKGNNSLSLSWIYSLVYFP